MKIMAINILCVLLSYPLDAGRKPSPTPSSTLTPEASRAIEQITLKKSFVKVLGAHAYVGDIFVDIKSRCSASVKERLHMYIPKEYRLNQSNGRIVVNFNGKQSILLKLNLRNESAENKDFFIIKVWVLYAEDEIYYYFEKILKNKETCYIIPGSLAKKGVWISLKEEADIRNELAALIYDPYHWCNPYLYFGEKEHD